MGKRVCVILKESLTTLETGLPIEGHESEGRFHRYLIPKPTELLAINHIYLVGFFGQKRNERASNYFSALDSKLIQRIPTYPEILSYSTLALDSGDYSNLVLLTEKEIKLKWMAEETHQHAVERSPGYYQTIRINNGVLPAGILQPESLEINQVKYFDYREDPPWKALRRLTQ